MSTRRQELRSRRGATLIEAMVAMAVLAAGTAGLATLISTVAEANQKMAFARRASEVLAQFNATIADAKCDVRPDNTINNDPLFNPATFSAFLAPGTACPALAGSILTICGDQQNWTPPRVFSPPLQLSFIVVAAATPPGSPPAFDIQVRVREVTGQASRDAVNAGGSHIREFTIKKLCNFRMDNVGRGEF